MSSVSGNVGWADEDYSTRGAGRPGTVGSTSGQRPLLVDF